MATPEEEQLRLDSRKLFHRIGNWGTLNALRQNLAVGRAETIRKYGDTLDDTTKAMLEDVPFGSVVNVTAPQTQAAGMSLAAKVVGAGLLVALAGMGGYMLADREPTPPPPVDAVLEWEMSDGEKAIDSRREDSGTSAFNLEVEAARIGRSDE